ncbi:hypothetical protein Cadr_000009529 [Camelus dromedarius]|uniref:Uncharacterized protein n=1 Tax=Camelus dromedarius TaxID=9838 RepID=A0A5N4DI02_CAMDR|nr:hypothetical protein Cadr_000009529 [Camelus dromedarius]
MGLTLKSSTGDCGQVKSYFHVIPCRGRGLYIQQASGPDSLHLTLRTWFLGPLTARICCGCFCNREKARTDESRPSSPRQEKQQELTWPSP